MKKIGEYEVNTQ